MTMYEFSLQNLFTAMAFGVPFCIGAYLIQNSGISKPIRGLLALCICVSFVIVSWLWYPAVHMDGVHWWQTVLCKHAIMFVLMLFGIAASVLVKAIDERHDRILAQQNRRGKNQIKLRIDGWNFIRPFLF